MQSTAPFHLLLIEDDEIDVENVRRALEENETKIPLRVASDGRAGLDLLESGEVETERLLILLDLNMPRMNGIEFLRAIRGIPKLHAVPVVVLTTSDHERDRVHAYELNVAGYLLKPVTYDRFVELIQRLTHYWEVQEFPS